MHCVCVLTGTCCFFPCVSQVTGQSMWACMCRWAGRVGGDTATAATSITGRDESAAPSARMAGSPPTMVGPGPKYDRIRIIATRFKTRPEVESEPEQKSEPGTPHSGIASGP